MAMTNHERVGKALELLRAGTGPVHRALTGEVHSTRGEAVAPWPLDTDYDGKTFE